MNILLSKFESIGLNQKVFTDEDLIRICRREKIKVFEIPMIIPGWYGKLLNKPHIYLDVKLKGIEKTYVWLHELAHHYLHAASYSNAAFFYCDRTDRPSKEHFEAEAFAALALIPYGELERLMHEEIEADSFQEKTIKFRLRLLDLYGV